MMTTALKTGLSIAVILTIAGVVQTGTLSDPLLYFVTVGLVPGTNIQLPPELVLLCVAAALFALTVLVFRSYIDNRIELRKLLSELEQDEDDPPLRILLPALGRLVINTRRTTSSFNDTLVGIYFWLRSFGDPVIVQAIHARQELATALVQADLWADRMELLESLSATKARARDYAVKAKDYLVHLAHR